MSETSGRILYILANEYFLNEYFLQWILLSKQYFLIWMAPK